jgi:hypothetical protein
MAIKHAGAFDCRDSGAAFHQRDYPLWRRACPPAHRRGGASLSLSVGKTWQRSNSGVGLQNRGWTAFIHVERF